MAKDQPTDRSWIALPILAVAVGLATWHREFGEIAAGAMFFLSLAFTVFCMVLYIKTDVSGKSTPKARAFYRFGQVMLWGVFAFGGLAAVGVFVALKLGG